MSGGTTWYVHIHASHHIGCSLQPGPATKRPPFVLHLYCPALFSVVCQCCTVLKSCCLALARADPCMAKSHLHDAATEASKYSEIVFAHQLAQSGRSDPACTSWQHSAVLDSCGCLRTPCAAPCTHGCTGFLQQPFQLLSSLLKLDLVHSQVAHMACTWLRMVVCSSGQAPVRIAS